MEGWICPRCRKSLAPWIGGCNCKSQYTDGTTWFWPDGTTWFWPAELPGIRIKWPLTGDPLPPSVSTGDPLPPVNIIISEDKV